MTLLHRAALAGGAAHAAVLLRHARRANAERFILGIQVEPRAEHGVHASAARESLVGRTAQELAAVTGHCGAAAAIAS
eukprot:SAG11_NODE_5160_length_1643_cov_5.228627_1_plen_77_part_10